MAQVYKKLNIDVNKKCMDIISAVQNDAQSRFLDVVLLDGSIPIDLTEHEVRIYGKKHDGTEFYNNGEITEATAGRCQFELTSQALAVANDLEAQIIVFQDNREILSTQPFTVHVVKSLMSDSSIESSNEYGALVVLYQNLYEAYDLMTEMVQKIGVPKEQAVSLGLDTMFEVWDWMVAYLQENSAAGIVETANTIDSKVGTTTDAGGTATAGTVMGKLNTLLGGSAIKSIQRGTVVFPTEDNISITISTINPQKTFVILDNSFIGVGNFSGAYVYGTSLVELTSTTLVLTANYMASSGGAKAYDKPVSYQVVEFY